MQKKQCRRRHTWNEEIKPIGPDNSEAAHFERWEPAAMKQASGQHRQHVLVCMRKLAALRQE
jgi:hypothetical protein